MKLKINECVLSNQSNTRNTTHPSLAPAGLQLATLARAPVICLFCTANPDSLSHHLQDEAEMGWASHRGSKEFSKR
jgi:hypothetical protein